MLDLVVLLSLVPAAQPELGQPFRLDLSRYDESKLQKEYEKFQATLSAQKLPRKLLQAIEALNDQNVKVKIEAMSILGRGGDPHALPFLVGYLESQDQTLRIWAGSSVSQLIENHVLLRRRDPEVTDRVVLKPRGQGDPDLRPLRWPVVRMLKRPDDGNTHAYAASMIRYLELREFQKELREMQKSRHPAVSNKAKWALEELAVKDDPTK